MKETDLIKKLKASGVTMFIGLFRSEENINIVTEQHKTRFWVLLNVEGEFFGRYQVETKQIYGNQLTCKILQGGKKDSDNTTKKYEFQEIEIILTYIGDQFSEHGKFAITCKTIGK